MPVSYDRDDARRVIAVTVTDPYTLDEILGAIDRQAAELTWKYAMVYDLRAVANLTSLAEALGHVVGRVRWLALDGNEGQSALPSRRGPMTSVRA